MTYTMPAIRTRTFQFDPDENGVETAADGGVRAVRQGPSNPRARDADSLAQKHDVDRRVVVGIVTFTQHRFDQAALIHLDPRRDGVAI